ncbi:hypothetical protein B5M09_010524 [Aphanomyces astaci]|uniref:Myb/SANT-like domain-containing protein n=1 Tax=Aphanomyces astaci TaxID=112090 RepID=A0A3R7Y936_APHAT|nr:hypothetical protein B5M09_010524 [Aphanomyces astaci]
MASEAPVVYTHSMVNALLELRFTGFRASFNADLSSKQLHVLWEKLALRFNILTEQPRKNKLGKLRSEFVAIQRSLTATGNDELSTPPKPSYYSEMLVAFADLHGLGDIEFGMERTPSASPGAEDDVEVLEDLHATGAMQQNKRKVEIDLEMQRQHQMRKKHNPDLAAGLSNLGEALASGLIEAAKVKNSRSSGVDMSEQMTKLLDLMEETKASIDKTNDVNDKMLQFLQGKF